MSVSGVFVGRAAELGVLTAAVARADAESPSTMLVGGESGIGKSRLVRELAAVARAPMLIGTCVELGGDGLPYAPFTAALRGRFPALAPDADGDAGTARVRLFERVLEQLDGLAAEGPLVLVIEDAALGGPVQSGPAGLPGPQPAGDSPAADRGDLPG